ncbi:GNAT family N-acetyltransferase [Paenibacillus amylolyticus]|nr:GNAT family N-acetyltransferase [Paenibacillus amylolyticus]
MSENEFEKFKEWSVNDYAEDLIKSKMSSDKEAAYQIAQKEFNEILPKGLSTENNFLYVIVNQSLEEVGFIWYEKENTSGFICDFLITQNYRNKGYGFQTMKWIEKDAKDKGMSKLRLSVFKFNEPACNLYNKLNYKIVEDNEENVIMEKILEN